MAEIFTPHELKTIEVDVEKKIFRVNGEDFGKGCTNFSITCDANKGNNFFIVRMETDTTIKFASYDWDGEKTSERKKERHLPETDAACDQSK